MASKLGNDSAMFVGANKVLNLLTIGWNETSAAIETTVLGDTWKQFIAGASKGWTATASGYRDDADATGQGALVNNAVVTLNMYPNGNVTGELKVTGTAIVTGIDKSTANDATAPISFTLQGTGALVETVIV